MPTDPFFRPVSGMQLPRFAGIPTFMRLPHVPEDHPRASEVQGRRLTRLRRSMRWNR